MPSVRDLARELRVNPNTIAKAYQRLVEAGVLETRRGEGTFVAAHPPQMSTAERRRVLREAAVRFTSFAATLGIGQTEAVIAIKACWPDDQESTGGGRR